MITVLIIILCVLIVVCIVLSSLYCFLNKILIGKTEIQSFHTESDLLKVAVISDTQLPPTKEDLENNDTYLKNLKKTLNVIKNNNVDMILFAGDIGDLGTYFAFETYENTIDEVFGDNRPIVQTVMGNHDFWHRDAKTATNHIKAFKEVTGKSPWTHYVVNGYHFIGASPDCGSMERAYNITSKWLDKELEKASADSDGKPIFVLTHNQPKDTCYGSDEWGDTSLNKVLEKHHIISSTRRVWRR